MKVFVKKYKVLLIILSLMIVWSGLSFYRQSVWFDEYKKSMDQYSLECEKGIKTDCIFLDKYDSNLKEKDTISTFFDAPQNSSLHLLPLLLPFLIIISAIWNFHDDMKEGKLKNVLTRISYKKYFWKCYLNSLKVVLIIPIYFLINFIFAYLVSGHFDINYTLEYWKDYLLLPENDLKNWPIFLPVFIVNLMIHAVFWINIGVLCVRNNNNKIVSIVTAFVVYDLIWIVMDFIGSNFMGGKYVDYFMFGTLWYYDTSYLGVSLIAIILLVISLIAVILIYRDKEKIIMFSEK